MVTDGEMERKGLVLNMDGDLSHTTFNVSKKLFNTHGNTRWIFARNIADDVAEV